MPAFLQVLPNLIKKGIMNLENITFNLKNSSLSIKMNVMVLRRVKD
jgi:hypothetical protein